MSDRERLDLCPDEYDRFILACKIIARENGSDFDFTYQQAVYSKTYAGPFYGEVVQKKMFAINRANQPTK